MNKRPKSDDRFVDTCNKYKASESSIRQSHKGIVDLGIKMNQMIISPRAEPDTFFFCIPMVECYHIAGTQEKYL